MNSSLYFTDKYNSPSSHRGRVVSHCMGPSCLETTRPGPSCPGPSCRWAELSVIRPHVWIIFKSKHECICYMYVKMTLSIIHKNFYEVSEIIHWHSAWAELARTHAQGWHGFWPYMQTFSAGKLFVWSGDPSTSQFFLITQLFIIISYLSILLMCHR